MSMLEMRVWQWVFQLENLRGIPAENVKALSKVWNVPKHGAHVNAAA